MNLPNYNIHVHLTMVQPVPALFHWRIQGGHQGRKFWILHCQFLHLVKEVSDTLLTSKLQLKSMAGPAPLMGADAVVALTTTSLSCVV